MSSRKSHARRRNSVKRLVTPTQDRTVPLPVKKARIPDAFPQDHKDQTEITNPRSGLSLMEQLCGVEFGILPQGNTTVQPTSSSKPRRKGDVNFPQKERAKTSHLESSLEKLPDCVSVSEQEDNKGFEGLKFPLTPTEALRHFGNRLTEFEQVEIMHYSEVWYLGLDARKISGSQRASCNSGYDNEERGYVLVPHDHIGYRFEILEEIGKGSFGQALKCLDHKNNEMVAIKVIRNKKSFHKQAMVELNILDLIRNKDQDDCHNVIHMKEYFYFRNHFCIVFELLGPTLDELIRRTHYQGFSLPLVRKFAYSLLKCLQMLKREKIIHCDLKPENILQIREGRSRLKVIDFGSSCFEDETMYDYIQTRYYRAPEVILGQEYTSAIDMWSLGCVVAELCTGVPLFPGESEGDQLACIMEVLGLPPDDVLQTSPRKSEFFGSDGNPQNIKNSMGRKRWPDTLDLAAVLGTDDLSFLDFIRRCLTWDPKQRMTPDEAMRHSWMLEGRPKARAIRILKRSHSSTGERALSNGSDMPTTANFQKRKPTPAAFLSPVGAKRLKLAESPKPLEKH
ncbi:dual specificity tyrosine-phosphorylation-regulated kinase 4-like [Chanos chanos]|uniref:dual-specificity kinase n=1 Tax=Chanos chanos TaxID=29144 RepID=A0A6J2WIW0_CHACN|nr:dual specificity tyrosine-phosphorylation-regulated kinase 4-like [Chanos chanos]